MKVYEAKSLIVSMEARSKSYKELREKLEQLKGEFNDIVNLDHHFQGKGADAIKGFYQAQMDVVEAWLRLIDRNIAFFNSIAGTTEDKDLSGDTVVYVPFLDDELTHHARSHKEMVSSQQDELRKIFNRIDDLISLDVFSRDRFDDHMEKAEKDRKDTVEAVEQLDNDLKSEYILSEGDEQYVVALFGQLMEASRQGSTIQPIHFNAEAYKASEVYQLKEQAEKQAKEYLSFKEEQERARQQLKKLEELENRPWYEKTWDGIKTFTGELTGYYDFIRASEGVDPVTGEKLTAGQRVAAGAMAAAGFIPVVGWAGRIVKGGGAIYKTAKGMHAAEQALDVYRSAKTFSNLEKAEMGIYGLVSANGFSEYITGKDMFGNELTDEQKQNSLYQALGLLAVGGMAYAPQLVQNGKMIREQTINKAHELATKTKAEFIFVRDEVKDGINIFLNGINNNRFALETNSIVKKIPLYVMDTESVKKVLDRVLSNFSFSGFGKGTDRGKGVNETNLKNIDDFINGNKKFNEVIEDYAKVYKEHVDLNKPWSWDDTIPGGDSLSSAQKRKIKEMAIEKGHIPEIKITKVDGMRYGFADFSGAGVAEETVHLPEKFWKLSDKEQFKWLDEQIGGTRKGMTWHHTEVPGKMELVPFGIHNITPHNGGRTKGMWADAPR